VRNFSHGTLHIVSAAPDGFDSINRLTSIGRASFNFLNHIFHHANRAIGIALDIRNKLCNFTG